MSLKTLTVYLCFPSDFLFKPWPPHSSTGGSRRMRGGLWLLAPACLGCTRPSYRDFLAILLVFISLRRSHSIFLRSWLDFPSLLASLNPSKSTKIRSQEAIHLGLQFLIDFWLIFMFNFHAPNLQNHGFSLWKTRFRLKIVFRSWHQFFMRFEWQLASILLPKSTKIFYICKPKRD